MKRYPAYDPPEYVEWRPEREVMEEFRARLTADAARAAILSALDPARHLALYAGLLRNRLHDIALKRWVKQGVLSKAWLGTGEEATTVGAAQALEPGDHVGPMIRNAGACHEMGMPVVDMLRAYLGTFDTITRGRDLHTGDPARGVVPPISMVGALVPVLTGIALGFQRQGRRNVALSWVGDGATRTWEFHEGANLAVPLRAPVILVIQNNQVALGTPLRGGVRGDLRLLHRAYGARGLACDGNNVLDVFAATRLAAEACRRGDGPVFLEAETFRMGGHATHDEAEARAMFDAALFAHWGKRDPIGMYETWLVESGPRLAGADSARAPAVRVDGASAPDPGVGPAAAAERRASGSRPHGRGAGAPEKTAAPGERPGKRDGAGRSARNDAADTRGDAGERGRGAAGPGTLRRGGNPSPLAEENRRILAALEDRIAEEVDAAAEEALRSRETAQPPPESAIEGVYAGAAADVIAGARLRRPT